MIIQHLSAKLTDPKAMGGRGEVVNDMDAKGTLFVLHNVTVIALNIMGILSLARATRLLFRRRHRLNSVVKAFAGTVLADWALIMIFMPQAIAALVRRRVGE